MGKHTGVLDEVLWVSSLRCRTSVASAAMSSAGRTEGGNGKIQAGGQQGAPRGEHKRRARQSRQAMRDAFLCADRAGSSGVPAAKDGGEDGSGVGPRRWW